MFNAVKHAGGDEARLSLVEGEDRLQVVVEDKGKGFDPEEAKDEEGGGHGLASVRGRIEMIGGTFEVESAPGEGTRVCIEVPRQSNGNRVDVRSSQSQGEKMLPGRSPPSVSGLPAESF